MALRDDEAIACVYCGCSENITPVDIVGSLLKQLTQRRIMVSERLKALYYRNVAVQTRPTVTELCSVLAEELGNFVRVFLVIDGLDECSESQMTRSDLLSELCKRQPALRLMVTSRPHLSWLIRKFENVTRFEISVSEDDMAGYVNSRIETEDNMTRWSTELKGTILRSVLHKSQKKQDPLYVSLTSCSSFFIAQVQMNQLTRLRTKGALHSALEDQRLLPELTKFYDMHMNRILSQSREDGETAISFLKWLAYAKKPLESRALQHAVAVVSEKTDIDDDDLIDIDDLVSICAGLVIIENDVPRLFHHTATQYLRDRFPNGNKDLATTCLRYFAFDVFDEPCWNESELKARVRRYRLSEYAASYWADHIRGTLEEQEETNVLAILRQEDRRNSIYQVWDYARYHKYLHSPHSILDIVCENGLLGICKSILNRMPCRGPP